MTGHSRSSTLRLTHKTARMMMGFRSLSVGTSIFAFARGYC
jgi:hypothetical protein